MTLIERIRSFRPSLAWFKDKPWPMWIGYGAFFWLALFASFWLTFPSDPLARRIELEAKRRLDITIVVGSVRPAGLSGVTLRDVDWILGESDTPAAIPIDAAAPAPAAAEGAGGGEAAPAPVAVPAGPPKVRIDSATLKVGLLAALGGKQELTFDVDAFGGEIEGRVRSSETERSIVAEVHDIALAESPIRASGMDMQGVIKDLTIDVTAEEGDLQKATGTVVVHGEGLMLNGGEVQHIDLPKIDMGVLDGTIEIGSGKADFTQFEIKGADLEAKIEGFIRLAPKLTSSTLSGRIKLKPSEEWWTRNEALKSMANFGLPAQKDGYRVINLFGQVGKPSFRPQR